MISKNRFGKNSSKKVRKVMLVGVALLAIGSSTSVMAAQKTDYSKLFFNGEEVIGSIENPSIGNQATINSGIKMNVEDSISGGKSALIIVSFEKEDGTNFSKGTFISNLEVDLKNESSYMVEQQLTADGKKLIAMFDIDTTSSLQGKQVTIQADAIMDGETIIAKGPFIHTFTAQDSSNNFDIDLTLKKHNEKYELQQLFVSNIGIGIEGKRIDGNTDTLPNTSPIVKVITKDDQVFELKNGSTSTTDIGFKWQYNLDSNGDRILLDKSTIKSIVIDDQLISIE